MIIRPIKSPSSAWMLLGLSIILAGLLFSGTPSPSSPLDGVWRSQGYGNVFVIEGPAMITYEVTATTCVPGFTARRTAAAAPDREATFEIEHGPVLFIRAGGDKDHKLLHFEATASDIRIDRLPALPDLCRHPTPNTPPDVFEVFARTWAENYISFDLKKADWDKVVAANRAKVTAKTTPGELFDILAGMIAPFNDAHTSIRAPQIDRVFRTLRPGTDRVVKGGMAEFRKSGLPALLAVTERAYLKTPLRKWCHDQLQYGQVDDATGYLRILSFSGFSEKGAFEDDLSALDKALDAVFSDPTLKRLIIDVRVNFGGADPLGLAIASRLATGDYLAYTKEARADAVDRNKWTPGDANWVRPSSRPGFRGPVVELIGPLTISAGETFTQALMGRTPHVTRIGENTQGVFSDVLRRQLPNGWLFWLPNEVFRSPEGTTFDGPGIPPDVPVPVFADEDVTAGRDPAMAEALRLLGAALPVTPGHAQRPQEKR
jgi:hypothetical protein